MNVLLVNNDAIITKLVKLSTQKTGDRLDVADSIETLRDESYDLLILDSGMFSFENLEAINDKVIYAHSLFITTRDHDGVELFEKLLYKPFLPTELLVQLHQFASNVEKEQVEQAKEIVFDDFENSFFSEDEIASEPKEVEKKPEPKIHVLEKVIEESVEMEVSLEEEDAPFDTIFSESEVQEVKAMLDALKDEVSSDASAVEELLTMEEPLGDVDLELEAALRHFNTPELSLEEEVEELPFVSETLDEEMPSVSPNQASIETLKTLLQALENPLIAKSLRGTITINLSFGEES